MEEIIKLVIIVDPNIYMLPYNKHTMDSTLSDTKCHYSKYLLLVENILFQCYHLNRKRLKVKKKKIHVFKQLALLIIKSIDPKIKNKKNKT